MTNQFQLEAAKALQAAFVVATRDDGSTFAKLDDSRAPWMQEAIRSAHDSRLPNDTDYAACREVVDAIVEALEFDEDMDVARSERVDGLVPIYNIERYQWLAQCLDYAGYCDDAQDEGLVAENDGMAKRVGAGMYKWYESIWFALWSAIEETADDLEVEADGMEWQPE